MLSRQHAPTATASGPVPSPSAGPQQGLGNAAVQDAMGPASLETDLQLLSGLLGQDVSGVDVRLDGAHGGGEGACAWTDGETVHLDPTAYRPGTDEGLEVLAHELCHVLQSGGQGSGDAIRPADTDTALGLLDSARDVLWACLDALEAGEIDAAELPGSTDEAIARLHTALSELEALDAPTSARDAADVAFLLLEAAAHPSAGLADQVAQRFSVLDAGKDDPLEREAHRVADRVRAGGDAHVGPAGPTPGVQRMAHAAAASPLLAGGPPGWAAYAVVVVGGLVVMGGVMHMSRSGRRTRTQPHATTNTGEQNRDLGAMRFQIQWNTNNGGPTFSSSVFATSDIGVPVAAAVAGMQQAHAQVTPNRGRTAAAPAVSSAIAWMQSLPPTGIAIGGYSKSFYFQYRGYGDARADVENIKGHNLRT